MTESLELNATKGKLRFYAEAEKGTYFIGFYKNREEAKRDWGSYWGDAPIIDQKELERRDHNGL